MKHYLKTAVAIVALFMCACLDGKAQEVSVSWVDETEVDAVSNVPEVFCAAASVDLSQPEIVVDATMSCLPTDAQFTFNTIPFGTLSISGNHVHIVMNKEEFMKRIYEPYKEQGFWDMKFSVYYHQHDYVTIISYYAILRIIW